MKFNIKDKFTFIRVMQLNRYMEGHRGFIAGGCFKNLFLGQKIKDIDIFFSDQEDFDHCLKLFTKDIENYSLYYENPKVVAFKNMKTKVTVELIRSNFGSAEEVLRQFDFSITKFAYFKETVYTKDSIDIEYKVMYVDTFFEDLTAKKLVIDGDLLFPVSSWERSYRYRQYGYGLCRESKAILLDALKRDNTSSDDLSKEMYFGMD